VKPNVIEVDEATFREKVLEQSATLPVVVDFWAPWCAPCRMLGPVMEELAAEDGGQWILAKVNVDECPELAGAFSVQGIPMVIAFVNGRPVNQFTGAQPKESVRYFLRSFLPSSDERVAESILAAVRLAIGEGRIEDARADFARLPASQDAGPTVEGFRTLFEWIDRVAARGGLDAIRARAADDPDRAANRYDYGCALALAGSFEGALAEFLEVVRKDRELEDDGGRKAMVALFGVLGDGEPLTREYRTLLSRELF
jgi:putative thioredoxin